MGTGIFPKCAGTKPKIELLTMRKGDRKMDESQASRKRFCVNGDST